MQRLLPTHLSALLILCVVVGRFVIGPRAPMLDSPVHIVLAVLLLCLGVTVLIWGNLHHQKFNSDHNTFGTPERLVTSGPFRLSRNPMYLGFFLILCATALWANAMWALIAPLSFLFVTQVWYIRHEERCLHETFGAEYATYKSRTRRWI